MPERERARDHLTSLARARVIAAFLGSKVYNYVVSGNGKLNVRIAAVVGKSPFLTRLPSILPSVPALCGLIPKTSLNGTLTNDDADGTLRLRKACRVRARVGVPYSPSCRTAYFQENPMSKPPSPFPSAGFDATASLWAFHYRPEPPSLFHSRPSRPSNFPLVEITAAASLLHLQTRRPGRAEALAAPGRHHSGMELILRL